MLHSLFYTILPHCTEKRRMFIELSICFSILSSQKNILYDPEKVSTNIVFGVKIYTYIYIFTILASFFLIDCIATRYTDISNLIIWVNRHFHSFFDLKTDKTIENNNINKDNSIGFLSCQNRSIERQTSV